MNAIKTLSHIHRIINKLNKSIDVPVWHSKSMKNYISSDMPSPCQRKRYATEKYREKNSFRILFSGSSCFAFHLFPLRYLILIHVHKSGHKSFWNHIHYYIAFVCFPRPPFSLNEPIYFIYFRAPHFLSSSPSLPECLACDVTKTRKMVRLWCRMAVCKYASVDAGFFGRHHLARACQTQNAVEKPSPNEVPMQTKPSPTWF